MLSSAQRAITQVLFARDIVIDALTVSLYVPAIGPLAASWEPRQPRHASTRIPFVRAFSNRVKTLVLNATPMSAFWGADIVGLQAVCDLGALTLAYEAKESMTRRVSGKYSRRYEDYSLFQYFPACQAAPASLEFLATYVTCCFGISLAYPKPAKPLQSF